MLTGKLWVFYCIFNFARCRMSSSSRGAWILDSSQFSSFVHPRSENRNFSFLWQSFATFTNFPDTFHIYPFVLNLSLLYIFLKNLWKLLTETCPELAPEYSRVPLAAGHWGSVTATAEGGEIRGSSCTCGAQPIHQACYHERRSYTVNKQTGVWACVWV